MATNLYHSAALLDETLTTVKCRFQKSEGGHYTFLAEKSLAAELAAGDLVVAQKLDLSYSIVEVEEVDEESDIDLNASFKRYSFLISKVDTLLANYLVGNLEETVAEIKKLQRTRLREQVKSELMLEFKGDVA